MIKRLLSFFLVLVICISLVSCSTEDNGGTGYFPDPADRETTAPEENSLVILYTNDVHAAYQRDDGEGRLGYAALAAYKKQLEDAGGTVVLIDGGDAIQGEAVSTLSKGSFIVDIMNETGYDLAVPGNHEFDYGMDTFLDLAENRAEYTYFACNFIDLRTGKPVFEPYKIIEYNGVQVAYVGICTPETFSKSTPAYFQNDKGEYIYGFAEGDGGEELYHCVQSAIDGALAEGADYVICVGHTGTEPSAAPWTTAQIIANTTGMSLYLDGHAHSVLEGDTLEDVDGNKVPVFSNTDKLLTFVQVNIDLNTGEVTGALVSGLTKDSAAVLTVTNEISGQLEDLLTEVVARSETDLITHDPEENTRLIRSRETNLGDLCADAYRVVLGADIGFVNGGGIRAAISEGPVTYGDIIAVHPYNNMACVVEATGQEILDALEHAYKDVGDAESGGFLQVSGLSCRIDTSIESTVKVDSKGAFVCVEGARRVSDVKVNGVEIDPAKTYTVASHDYLLKLGGDGYTMFLDNKVVKDEVMTDNALLICYIQDTLGGVIRKDDNMGNRIAIAEAAEAAQGEEK